jgi:integrase
MASTRTRTDKSGQYIGTSVLWREDGKQRSKLFPSSEEAQSFKLKVEAGVASTAVHEALLFGAFVLTMWLPCAGLADSTGRGIRSAMANDLKPLASRTLAWVASHRAEVQAVIAASKRSDHGLLYMVVKLACDEAVASGKIDTHRLAGIRVKRNNKRREIIETTPQQRAHIASRLGANGLAVWIMHDTGMRIGEVLGLRGSDFRDHFATVRVQRKAYKGDAGPLKARKDGQFRDVPVPAWLAAMIKAYVSEHGLGAMFPGRRGKEFISYEAVGTPIARLAAEVGLEGFTAHQFRHAFATNLLARRMPIHEVAAWLGDGVKVVQETYAHVLKPATDQAREILDAVGM